jgi:hypothetical protein
MAPAAAANRQKRPCNVKDAFVGWADISHGAKEPMMKSRDTFFEVSRRAMLSAFAALPALPMLMPVSALAQTAVTDPLASWNDTATKKAIVTFVGR